MLISLLVKAIEIYTAFLSILKNSLHPHAYAVVHSASVSLKVSENKLFNARPRLAILSLHPNRLDVLYGEESCSLTDSFLSVRHSGHCSVASGTLLVTVTSCSYPAAISQSSYTSWVRCMPEPTLSLPLSVMLGSRSQSPTARNASRPCFVHTVG